MSLTLTHFRANCIGCGSCVELCPEHWVISKSDGKATLKGSQKKGKCFVKKIHAIDRTENEEAALACPVGIIRLQASENCKS